MITVAIGLFVIASAVATIRLLIGPGLAERIVALDVALLCFMGALACYSASTGSTIYLIAVVVLAIIGFTATVSAARFLQHHRAGARTEAENQQNEQGASS